MRKVSLWRVFPQSVAWWPCWCSIHQHTIKGDKMDSKTPMSEIQERCRRYGLTLEIKSVMPSESAYLLRLYREEI